MARGGELSARVDLVATVAIGGVALLADAAELAGTSLLAAGVGVARVVLARVDLVALVGLDGVLLETSLAHTLEGAGASLDANTALGVARVRRACVLLSALETITFVTGVARALEVDRTSLLAAGVDVARVGSARILLDAAETITRETLVADTQEQSRAGHLALSVDIARVGLAGVDSRAGTAIGR
jgi:hypothetical protein